MSSGVDARSRHGVSALPRWGFPFHDLLIGRVGDQQLFIGEIETRLAGQRARIDGSPASQSMSVP
jgi:hypothetical protein